MTTARYDRALDPRLVKHLKPGGDLDFLLHGVPFPTGEPYAVDVHLRERNKIMYYRGTTRILVVKLSPHGDRTPTFTVTADKFYSRKKSCADAFHEMENLGKMSPINAKESFRRYLEAACPVAPEGHYRNKAEGYWQNRICHRFGRCFRPDDEWLVFDRECVIGFKNKEEKDYALAPIVSRYREACKKVQEAGNDKWRLTNQSKGLGDELDMLAVGRDGQLLAIELKYRTNASGIYWGPAQAGVYGDSFSQLLDALGPSVIDLVKQKVSLGLLPEHALDRLPADGFKRVRAILAVADANPKSGCWPKMTEVMKHVGQVDVATIATKATGRVELPGIHFLHMTIDD